MTENVLIPKEKAKNVAKILEAIMETNKETALVNIDYEDWLTLLQGSDGAIMFGKGKGEGKDRISKALNEALKPPENIDLLNSSGAIITVRGGPSMTVEEAKVAIEETHKKVNPEATIIWGASIDPKLKDTVEVFSIFFGVK